MHFALAAVLAASDAESAHSNPLVPEFQEVLWGAIAFLLFLVVMSKFVFPVVDKTMKERTENIEGKLEQAERERAEATALARQYEQKLNDANAESQRMLAEARANADRLEAELRTKAEEQSRRIVERAQETIQGERDRALSSLRNEVGSLAVDLASRVVGESLDRDRSLRLVDQYIEELSSQGSTA